MKISFIVVAFTLLGATLALPQYGYEDNGEWKTWGAIKNFFRPMTNWFSQDLPNKSPSDLMEDVQDSAISFKNWAGNNAVIQGVGDAVRPVRDWVQDGVDFVKDKPISVLYGDVKDSVSDIDENFGGWIDRNVG